MSLENAIHEHALALKELAAAIRATGSFISAMPITAPPADSSATVKGSTKTEDAAPADKKAGKAEKPKADKTADKADAAAVTETKADASAGADVVDQATIDKVNQDAAAADAAAGAGDPDSAELDYAKEVRPMLLAAIKKGKRGEIEAHLAKAGVKKADELPAAQWPALLELATKLAA